MFIEDPLDAVRVSPGFDLSAVLRMGVKRLSKLVALLESPRRSSRLATPPKSA